MAQVRNTKGVVSMGKMRVIRKFYGTSNPNSRGYIYHVEFQEDCVVIRFPGGHDIYMDPLASQRLGECLTDNANIPKILSQVVGH